MVSGASANILRNRSFQNLRSAEAAITGSVYLDTKCCHMWRLEGCHDVSFICTARELSNCFRTSRTSSLVRISTCRHSHVCIILRWKVDIFCALACLFQVLFRWANQQEDEREVCGNFAAISRAAQTIYLYLYLSISMSIYLLGEGNLHRTQLTWLVRCWGGQAEGNLPKRPGECTIVAELIVAECVWKLYVYNSNW